MAERIWSSVGRRQLPEDLRAVLRRHKIPDHELARYEKDVTPEVARRQFARWLRAQPFSGGELAYDKLDDDGNVYRLVSMAWPNKRRPPDDYFIPLVHPATGRACPVPARGWRNSPATMADLLARGEIVFGPDDTTQPQRKYLLKDNMTTNVASVIPYGGSDDRLMEMLGIPFDTVKPVELVRPLVASCTGGDDIVLDFFAGSASTAHAVAVQNQLDGARRRCISVDVPEPTPASSSARRAGFARVSDLTYARLVAIGEQVPSAREQGLRVYVLGDPA
jgi:adenine-specific DNA-methyltransferase